ncbi:MAG TPA: hypothetical protein P5533_00580 [Candidatus Cloacimonadota bacterium]|nr:hypothetical protein [Candidatus Cloacimonadota bacterium]
MNCPVCQHDTRVTRTLKLSNPHTVIRNRVCSFCGYYFSTQERMDKDCREQIAPITPKDR